MNNNLDINDWTIDDLFSLYQLDLPVNKEKIQMKTNDFLSKYAGINDKEGNIRSFFNKANLKLIASLESVESTKNIYDKIIYINSNYRKNNVYDGQYSSLTVSNMATYNETDFIFSLTESMKNVTALSMLSLDIPYTWYNIDSAYSNNCLWIDDTRIEIPNGHYTVASLVDAFNNHIDFSALLSISYNSTSYKISINKIVSRDVTVTFHRKTETWRNYNLGWVLGFRDFEYSMSDPTTSIQGEELINLSDSQYFFILLDDYNNNKISANLITLYDEESSLTLPDYFSNNLDVSGLNADNIVQYNQGVPRQITQTQQYTLNEILIQRQKPTEKLKFAINADVLAIIPVDVNGLQFAQSSFSYTGNYFVRKYSGKVDIDRMRIRLINERGQLVNLNGAHWSIVLKSSHE